MINGDTCPRPTTQGTWSTDWAEAFTPTWAIDHADEHDLDVHITLDVTGMSGAVVLYGSATEVYTSAERGHHQTTSGTGDLVVPHYTFSDRIHYVSILSDTTEDVTLMVALTDINADRLTQDTERTFRSCPTSQATPALVCSGRGSCIDECAQESIVAGACAVDARCVCDDGYSGADCAVEAFAGHLAPGPGHPGAIKRP
jgi:hypothetical protein